MDTPAKTALGGGLISMLAFGGMVTAGVLATTAAVVVSDPTAPPAGATGLVRFADCDTLRQWYVDHAIDEVGPWGWGGRMMPMYAEDTALERQSPVSSSGKAVANGDTGTNTQEAGVDEPDVAKTDGRVVVQLRDGRRLVVTDVSGASPREIADWRLPSGVYAEGLLLVDDHVLLSSGGVRLMGREGFLPYGSRTSTEVYDVDLTDPADPRLDGRATYAGAQLSMRQYGDTVRLVTTLGLPALKFVQPRPGSLSERQAERENREIVRSSRIQDWIPGLSCDEVYHPQQWSGPETVVVSTFHPGAPAGESNVAVTGAGSEVYSSTHRLYVTATDWPGGPIPVDRSAGPDTVTKTGLTTRTHIHAFALDGDSTRYVASGAVDGSIRDRWSLDEHDGLLRVAVSWRDRSVTGGHNGIVVLDERDGRLQQVGQLRGLGVGEDIQSVRWFDDLAVVVTFRQMDPLYTIDLSEPTDPRRLGELKVPGFSAYLHPIGGDRLLGIGIDATARGENLGAQAAVFDLGDTAAARQVGKVTFGPESWFEAGDDPHAFTWLPDAEGAIANLERGSGATQVLLRVARDGSLSASDLPSVGGWGARALPLPDKRVALAGNRVRIVDVG